MENTRTVSTLGDGWKTLHQDVIFHIFSWLDFKAVARMAELNQLWQTLISDNKYWKPIVLKYISPPKTEPTSWKALCASHYIALQNLQSGKGSPSSHQQTSVDAFFSYGEGPDTISDYLVLLKDGGKRVERWDMEGKPTELWSSDTPFEPTEIIWGKEGPELLLYQLETFQWVLLRLKDPTKNVSGKESSWAPNDLGEKYLSLAQGNRIGTWLNSSAQQPNEYFPPIPGHTQQGNPYFVLFQGMGYWVDLKVYDHNRNEKVLSQGAWVGVGHNAFLALQPTTDGPTYLTGINHPKQGIVLWNTDTWIAYGCRLSSFPSYSFSETSIQYFKSGGHHYLAASQKSTLWLSEFDPAQGIFIGKTQIFDHRPDHFLSLSVYGKNLLIDVQKAVLTPTLHQIPACLSVWQTQSESRVYLDVKIKFDTPNLQKIALCKGPKGDLALACLYTSRLKLWLLNGDTTQLPPYSPIKHTFRSLASLPPLPLLAVGISLLLITGLAGVVVYETSRAIWRSLPSIKGN